MSDEFTYKPQDVHYLGFLEAQLRDMQGIDVLAYELIQNADDAPQDTAAPTTLCFNVTDEALVVSNDGVFRPLDFTRLQTIASGGKREESGVTGAFGLGFLAVYQITDRPEIFSNGRHWTIQPDAATAQRIIERPADTAGTTFRLPWAVDPQSAVRRALRLSVVQPAQLDDFAAQFSAAIGLAALFLRQIHTLEVRRNDTLIHRLTRHLSADGRIHLHDEHGRRATWLLLHGDFASEAAGLRAQYPWQIEDGRRSAIHIALPTTDLSTPGRFFAGLPTATTMPLPLHLNADFFPTTDRKRIHFDGGYQADWNHAALRCAAQTLAEALPALPAALGPANLWRLLGQMAHAHALAHQGDLPAALAIFWQTAVPILPTLPLLFTVQQTWALPADVRLWDNTDGRHRRGDLPDTAAARLTALDIPLVHADLWPYFALLRRPEIGAPDLSIWDVTAALTRLGLDRPMSLAFAPAGLGALADWQTLWHVLDELLSRLVRPNDRAAAVAALNQCALVLTEEMTLQKPGHVYRGSAESRALFPAAAWLHPAIPSGGLLDRLVSPFGARQAVDLLADTPPDQLAADWQHGRLDIPRFFRWLEGQQIEIFADDPTLSGRIRRLPLCPVDGMLRPLNDLYLPGGFADPLKLAGLVDLEAIGGRRQFLQDLGVIELDFITYVQDVVPRVLAANPDLPSDARHQLVDLLAQRLGELRDDEDLQERLGQLPLVACLDGSFRPATAVYASREVMALLGEQVHVAEPAASQAVQALHRWLGVRQQPSPPDLVAALLAIGRHQQPGALPDMPMLARLTQLWQRLAELPADAPQTAVLLAPLRDQPVLPDGRGILTAPAHLLLADRPELAARFHALPDSAATASIVALPGEWVGITAVIGLRSLSQVVVLTVDSGGQSIPDAPLAARIRQRQPLIARLLRAEFAPGQPPPTDWLAKLPVLRAERLQVQYRLTLGTGEILATAPEDAAAKLVGETAVLYVVYTGDGAPWTAVARELALALRPQQPPGGLALGIKEVLSAPSLAAAAEMLAELGYGDD
ncbi:MAG: DUF3684 domain-containing protein [Chloroflexi bacterium]|nr:DUF3684 domain-containing protein [Chloroflexota bacterium]